MSKTLTGTALLLLLLTPTLTRSADQIEKQPNGAIVPVSGGLLKIQFYSDSIVRVSFAKNRKFFARQTLDVIGKPLPTIQWTLEATPKNWNLKGKELTLSIERSTGKVQFLDPNEGTILTEDDRQIESAQVQGEKTFHVRQKWATNPEESLYGLGQNQFGSLDLKGLDLDLWQHNTNVAVPFLVSSGGYGILWDNTSFTRFGDLREFAPIPAENLYDRNNKPGGLTVEPIDHSAPTSQTTMIDIDLHPKRGDPRPPATHWEGFINAPEAGDYQFDCRSNGGIKVWLDGNLIMDHWRQGWLADHDRAKVRLDAGKHYPIKIEWDTEQGTTLQFFWKTPTQEYQTTSLWSEVSEGVDYYFIYGPQLDKVVAGYRTLTGQAPMMPSWAFGLWQSRQRYETSQQSLDVVDGFRKHQIPFDNIVQDWMYWRPDAWGSHQFDSTRFPDPDGWLKALHEKHAHVMISAWSKFYPGTANFDEMHKHGYLYELNLKEGIKDWLKYPFTFYDAFNPKARQLFWDQINTNLFQKGIDAWWLDSVEPDLMPSPPDREQVREHMNPTALGTGSSVLNAYPLMNSQGIYEGQRKTAPNQRVFILTRSAFAGSQRTASSVWSGDITSTWAVFAKQIPAGLNFSLSGMPYWSTDIGGYTMQHKFSTDHPKPEDEEEWRELNTRWFQFGTFCPLLRVHGESRHREMWELGDEDSPAYKAELKFDRLRYHLFPYLYSTAWEVTDKGGTFMRPLVMDFPQDPMTRGLPDEYMFGHAFLVAPVTKYKARTRSVYLPPGTDWYDFWTGQSVKTGTHEAPSAYDSLPLFVRAGSIVPFGPELQYVSEKPQDPITLYIYSGADGNFTLYEDDGLTYSYEKREFSEIPIHWDDTAKKMTFGKQKGSFPGMLKERTFNLVLVSKNKPVGFSFEPKPISQLRYDGQETSLELGVPQK